MQNFMNQYVYEYISLDELLLHIRIHAGDEVAKQALHLLEIDPEFQKMSSPILTLRQANKLGVWAWRSCEKKEDFPDNVDVAVGYFGSEMLRAGLLPTQCFLDWIDRRYGRPVLFCAVCIILREKDELLVRNGAWVRNALDIRDRAILMVMGDEQHSEVNLFEPMTDAYLSRTTFLELVRNVPLERDLMI